MIASTAFSTLSETTSPADVAILFNASAEVDVASFAVSIADAAAFVTLPAALLAASAAPVEMLATDSLALLIVSPKFTPSELSPAAGAIDATFVPSLDVVTLL